MPTTAETARKSNQSAHGSASSFYRWEEGGEFETFPRRWAYPEKAALQRCSVRHRVPEAGGARPAGSRGPSIVAKPAEAVATSSRMRVGPVHQRAAAAEGFVGSVERLAWARDHGCPMDTTVCATVALHGQLDVLKWAVEQGLPWDALTTAAAAGGGRLDVLNGRGKGCPWLCWTIESAAEHGHLEVLVWARERGCEWSPLACSLRRGGHLQVLRWLRDESVHGKGRCALGTRGPPRKRRRLVVVRWAYQIGGCSINATRCIKRGGEWATRGAEIPLGAEPRLLRWDCRGVEDGGRVRADRRVALVDRR